MSVWRRRDFRLAWTAGFVNNTGDWVLTIGLPVFVFVSTRSGTSTAIVFLCELVAGAVLGPVGGSLVDRWNLRRCLIATNLAQAVTLLPLLAVDAGRVWPAYPVVAVQAALRQLNDPANVAVVPRVVPAAELTRANAALAASSSLARLIGSPLGGVLVAWRGLGPIVVLDTISFAVAAAAIAFVTTNTDAHPTPDGGDRGVRDGIRVVRGSPILGRMLVLHSFSQLAQGCFLVLFVVFVVERIGDDGSGLGLIRGTMAVGGLIGSAIIGRIASRVQSTTLFAAGLVGMGAVAFVFWNAPALTTALWAYVVLFSLSGIPGSALAVGFLTTVQTHTPGHALGRIAGLMGAAEAVAIAFASMVMGTLVDHVPLAPLLDTQASIYVVAGLAAFVLVVRGQPASGNATDVTGDRPSEW